MGTPENYISVMTDSLNKKIRILKEIVRQNGIQKEILSSEPFDSDRFEQNVEEKGLLIEQLSILDDGFISLYNRIKEEFENSRKDRSEEIKLMQALISKITDISVQIQTEEARNKILADKQFSILKKEVKLAKKSGQMASNYYKSMGRVDSEPQFLDKKK